MKTMLDTSWGPVAVHQTGSTPRVLFVPGVSLGAASFDYHEASVIFEFPGTGDSPRAKQPALVYTLEAFVGILAEVAEALFPHHPPVVVGHSLGGHLVLQAMARGWRPAGAILVATPPLEGVASLAEALQSRTEMGILYAGQISPAQARQGASVVTTDRGLWFNRVVGYLAGRDPLFGPTLQASFTSAAVANEAQALKSAGIPYLALLGSEDAIVERSYWEAQLAPEHRKLIDGAGHCPSVEAKEWFNTRVLQFVQSVVS